MPYTRNGDVRLHWDEQGAGTPVLLVMGATYSSRMWYPAIGALAQRHRVICFDNRGIGRSGPSKPGSIEDMACDALAVLDAAGVDSAHVYGASLGGVVVLQMALQSPERVRSLVLGCTGILSSEKPRTPRQMDLLAYIPASVRRRLLRAVLPTNYGTAASPDAVATDLDVLAQERASTGPLQQQRALRSYSVEPTAIAQIELPALVLHGTEDVVVPLSYGQELADTLPQSDFVTLPGAGHNYLIAHRAAANEHVLAFLDDVDGRTNAHGAPATAAVSPTQSRT